VHNIPQEVNEEHKQRRLQIHKQFPHFRGPLGAMGTIASEGGRNDPDNDPGGNYSGATSKNHNFCTVAPIDSVQNATESLEH
ncbi:hypothetical protein KI387_040734, partial [Taxus chinensis]